MASIDMRKNGTYRVRAYLGTRNGKQKVVSATYVPPEGLSPRAVKKDIQKFALMFESAVKSGVYVPGMQKRTISSLAFGMTLEDYVNEFFYPRIASDMSPNTVKLYKKVSETRILPLYGNVRLLDISAEHLKQFVRELTYSSSGLSGSTVKRYATVFCSMMKYAKKDGLIEINPFSGVSVEYPKAEKKEVEAYDESETKAFIEALSKEDAFTRAMLMTYLFLGLRRAEAVALKWSDISFDDRSLTISRSAYKSAGEAQALKSPKTKGSVRRVFFPESLDVALTEWKAEQDKFKSAVGDAWHENDYVFTNSTGEMKSLYYPTELYTDFEKRHGLRHLKLHGLRHTCGSLMLAHGVDPVTVSHVLGHTDLKTTQIYLHTYDSSKRNAAQTLGKIFETEEAV